MSDTVHLNDLLTLTAGPPAIAVALIRAGVFDTYMVYEQDDVWYVAGGCRAEATLDSEAVRVRYGDMETCTPWRSRPLVCLGEALARLPIPGWTAYGWLAFEAAHLVTDRRDLAGNGTLAHVIVPKIEIRIDRFGVQITCDETDSAQQVREVLDQPIMLPHPGSGPIDITKGRRWYQHIVADALNEIRSGSLQKVVLSRRIPIRTEIDFPQTYLLGRSRNTPSRSFLLDMGGRKATGFCPETVLESATARSVSIHPLAGTRPLENFSEASLKYREELLADPKEIYEHALSVKAVFDELSQVCLPDTVTVDDLMSIEQRNSVQHLGSNVRGELHPDRSVWEALEAVFPAVTVSGIPKVAACRYITHVEQHPRGLYAGGVLRVDSDGKLDVGLVLRSLFEEKGRRWLQAGAGIVESSRPEFEYAETCGKLRSISPYLVEKQGEELPVNSDFSVKDKVS